MHIVLPPSETKRDGGNSLPLDVSALSFPGLHPVRRKLVSALVSLSRDEAASLHALKLGPKGAPEVARNRVLKKSPTLPALERYTGVLYDALDAPSLDGVARARAGERVLIHSALFGLVRADDAIPAYRLSHDSRLTDEPLKSLWAGKNARVLAGIPGLILDARSEGYVELGPAPAGERSVFLRVVTRTEGGQVRALNHFNKKAKGEFTRALVSEAADPESLDELIDVARALGWRLEPGAPGELNLEV
ncbi:MAG TPA: peroxide stress protein YaaA [Microbacteriaceae bacterium]|nr:peroxide stress protein YaaA [Microbacteriaceae bacterium]